MTSMKKQVLSVFILLACVAGFSLSASAADKLKVGFVYISPIGDAGWTYQHDLGRLELEKNLGDKIETKYIESVPEGPRLNVLSEIWQKVAMTLFYHFIWLYESHFESCQKCFPKNVLSIPPDIKQPKMLAPICVAFMKAVI